MFIKIILLGICLKFKVWKTNVCMISVTDRRPLMQSSDHVDRRDKKEKRRRCSLSLDRSLSNPNCRTSSRKSSSDAKSWPFRPSRQKRVRRWYVSSSDPLRTHRPVLLPVSETDGRLLLPIPESAGRRDIMRRRDVVSSYWIEATPLRAHWRLHG